MRIGILGGTFDPVHRGHLYLAKKVINRLSLDKVIFIPVHLPPHKKNITPTASEHRYNMVKLAIGCHKKFEISDIEIKRKGWSYSVETLRQLRKQYRYDTDLYFITGSDSLKELDKWKNLESFLKLCRLVIVKRPHFSISRTSISHILVNIDAKDISSTEIRQSIKQGKSVRSLVPEIVLSYIKKHKLYA